MKRTILPLSPSVFFVLFAISGFSGLIYESIWTHYIKLFLGHAAYAQTLVLAIFMGGMAGGAWLAARWSNRWRNPLTVYAYVEALVGLAAVCFHHVFVVATDASYQHIIPALGSPAAAQAWKWVLSAALILPQSILLGMTFPLMSGGILRRWPNTPGRSLAMLYFTNSIGGAIGVLVSGFYLITVFGLPGTIMSAGLINILLALVVWLLTHDQPMASPMAAGAAGEPHADRWMRWMLAVAAITGAASFVYEIAWIRMLSLVLGSSTHAFELMLSAFILGLALGGLWIKRRIETLTDPMRTLGYIQVVMGLLALATLPLYNLSFDIMFNALQALSRTDGAYHAFNLISHFICLLVMLPATFCAGMTLPLITFLLLKRGHGEKSIGAVYSANTVGGIVAVLLAVNVLMPLLGVKGLLGIGAVLDLGLGILLLKSAMAGRRFRFAAIAATATALLASILVFAQLDMLRLSSGVYRGNPAVWPKSMTVVQYHDGKTATVALLKQPSGGLTLLTNGKADAKINVGPGTPTPDEPTMILLGALPLAANPHARTAANIGMGSGLTAHTLLSTPQLERLDIIEIEAEMINAARGYGERVRNVFEDPRSHINIEDAKVFFSTRNTKYDVIISEPSNPWVSGVASLFSQEFYKHVNRYLADDGVFAQWVQLYEIDLKQVASIMGAVSSEFSDYTVIALTDFDILILARKKGQFGGLSPDFLSQPGLAKALERVGMKHPQDVQARWVGNKRTLDPMFESFGAPINSDYYPYVDQNAVRTRFMNVGGLELTFLALNPLPLLEMVTPPHTNHGPLTGTVALAKAQVNAAVRTLRKAIIERRYGDAPSPLASASMLLPHLFVEACDSAAAEDLWINGLLDLATLIVPESTPSELEPVWARITEAKCFSRRSVNQKQWLALVRAVSDRNAPAMIATSEKILADAKAFKPSPRMQYALRAAILGNLVAGDRGNTTQLWQAYGTAAFAQAEPPLDVRMMITLDEPDAYKAWRTLFAARTQAIAEK